MICIINLDHTVSLVLKKLMQKNQQMLSNIPSVDECLKSSYGMKWIESYPRKSVLKAVRMVLDAKRKEILSGLLPDVSMDILSSNIEKAIRQLSSYRLKPVINATGVVI